MHFLRQAETAEHWIDMSQRFMATGAALVTAMAICLCGMSARAGAEKSKSAPAVTVEIAEVREIKKHRSFSGRIEAISKIELRARVTGFLTRRAFEEGSEVQKGDLLFEIEPLPYQIAVESAQADVKGAVGAEQEARDTFGRIEALQKNQTASRATFSAATARLQQAEATTAARMAQLRQAQLELSYTKISANIDGRIGRAAHSVGDLIDPTSSPLATLVSQDPIYVAFPVPQPVLVKAMKSKVDPQGITVELKLADGTTYPHTGAIAFADTEAAVATDTVIVRAKIANPDGHLVDQQLIDVVLVDKAPEKKLMISQSAILLDQQGSYVLAVDDANKVEMKRIELGKQIGAQIVVISGVSPGDRVIVSGHHSVHPGILVTAKVQPSSPDHQMIQTNK